MNKRFRKAALGTLGSILLVTLAGCGGTHGADASPTAAPSHAAQAPAADRPVLGLFTTLPLIWGENADIGAMLAAPQTPTPSRRALEAAYRLEPLDLLTPETLAPLERLALIQPRVLGPAENYALDTWIRAGGRAVLFADPLLTRHSIFPLGDKRRPQDTAVLSPILARWGLQLEHPDAGEMPSEATVLGQTVPLREAGRLRVIAHEAPGTCTLLAGAVAAQCVIGEGSVLVIADAALFDDEDDEPGAHSLARRAASLISAGLGD